MEVTCDITGTEAEILSQIRRYQKNAAVKSTAGSEQGEGDDFEVKQRYYLTQMLMWKRAYFFARFSVSSKMHNCTCLKIPSKRQFQACWLQSKEEVLEGAGKPIPGHPRPIPAHKSPKAKSPRSPGGGDFSKSPRSPGAECSKSPKSPVSDIVGLPDEDLRKLKISLLSSSPEK